MQHDADECMTALFGALEPFTSLTNKAGTKTNLIDDLFGCNFVVTHTCTELPEEKPKLTFSKDRKLLCMIDGEVNTLKEGLAKKLTY
jgi:hypothetical protein